MSREGEGCWLTGMATWTAPSPRHVVPAAMRFSVDCQTLVAYHRHDLCFQVTRWWFFLRLYGIIQILTTHASSPLWTIQTLPLWVVDRNPLGKIKKNSNVIFVRKNIKIRCNTLRKIIEIDLQQVEGVGWSRIKKHWFVSNTMWKDWIWWNPNNLYSIAWEGSWELVVGVGGGNSSRSLIFSLNP